MRTSAGALTVFGAIGIFGVLAAPVATLAKPPLWDKVINKPTRFKVLSDFANDAVLDKETGLVWERDAHLGDPDQTAQQEWKGLRQSCYDAVIGGRAGWRGPTASELSSLLDPSNANPALPLGHPFLNVQLGDYWTTSIPFPDDFPNTASTVSFLGNGDVSYDVKSEIKFLWCVRGPE